MRAPRARACSRVSMTMITAPSPRTNPSRPVSHGREACSGSSLRRLRACIWAKALIGNGWTTPSEPPTTAMSQRPSRIWSRPREMASFDDAHALTGAWTPAAAPNSSPKLAAGALAISMGMVKGETRRSPFSFWTSQLPSKEFRPPIPVPTHTASRSGSVELFSPSPRPASFQASWPATIASCELRSRRRAATRFSLSAGSPAASAAKVTGSGFAQS